jgi:LysM repeat protein
VSEEDLQHWNGLDGNRIQLGQKLKYLAPASVGETPAAAASQEKDDGSGDSEERAHEATAPRLSPVAVAGFMPVERSARDDKPAPREEKQYYIVKAGDSLWDISVRYRSTVQKLKDLNGRLPSVLRPGTRIRVK